MAVMAMPEAAIDENKRIPGPQDDVGPTREVFGVQAVAESRGMQDAADGKLGAGVLALDAGHNIRTPFRREHINHDAHHSRRIHNLNNTH